MNEKSYNLENPSKSPTSSISGLQKAIYVIFVISTLVFIGYYFFLLPYHDDSDLDDLFKFSEPSSYSTTDKGIEDEDSNSNIDDIFGGKNWIPTDSDYDSYESFANTDFIGTTVSSIESEELIPVDYFEFSSSSEGSGDDDHDPNCSHLYKLPGNKKQACMVQNPKTPKEAAIYCKSHGMKLLKITDDKIKQKVFDISGKMYGVGGGTALWIDGKWNEDREDWESWHDDTEILMHPTDGYFGDCSRVYSPHNQKFEISSANCDLKSYFYCEKVVN